MQQKLTPIKIVLIYLLVAGGWIVLTDHVLYLLVQNPDTGAAFQTYKGIFYVLITSVGLYYLIRRHDGEIEKKEKALERQVQEHRSQQEFLEKLIDLIPILITIYDPELNKIEVNKEFEKVSGWTNEEIQQINLLEHCYPDPEVRESAIRYMSQSRREWKEFPLSTKSGNTVPTRWSNIQLTNNIRVGIGIDISERKENERELKLQKQKLEQAQQIAQIGYWEYDLQTKESTWSDSLYAIHGFSRENLPPSIENFMKIVHPDDRDKFENLEDLLIRDEHLDSIYRIIDPNGQIQYCHSRAQVIRDSEGNPTKFMGTVIDITDLKETEKELQKSQRLLQKTFESLQAAICIIDTETRTIIECNQYTEEIFGFSREELIGECTRKLHTSEENYHIFDNMGKDALEKHGVFNTEFTMRRKNGEHFYSDHTVTLVYDEDGDTELAISVIRDITDRKQYENELRESRERLARAQRLGRLGDWEYDPDTDKINGSPMVYKILGLDPDDTLPTFKEQLDRYYVDQPEFLKTKVEQALNSGIPYDIDIKLHPNEGHLKYVRVIGKPIIGESGSVEKIIGTVQDITERKQAEEKLHESERKYRLLFENNPQAMWIYDPSTLEFVEVNKAAISHYGYSKEEFMNMTLLDIRPDQHSQQLKTNIKQNRGEYVYGEEWVHFTKEGKQINVMISAAPFTLEGKQYRLVVIKDITELKRAEKKVLNSLIEGEERERKRIAKELHDGLAQYLSASNMNFQAMKNVVNQLPEKRVLQFNRGLNLLQNAIEDTRNIAHNLMPSAIEDYGLELAVQALIDQMQSISDISFQYSCNLGGVTISDQAQINLYRIIQEALGNAIKHAACTNISLQLYKYDNIVTCMIEDNGTGVKDNLFEHQGMGIQSMKTRVRALSGTIEFTSKPGKGFTILIELPLQEIKED